MPTKGKAPRVSVVIITRNEAARIQACLDSAAWADEIIVVDQFSQDETAAICRQEGARVFQRELTRFGEQKQFAVDQATGDWIFNLDADESVPPALRDELLEAFRSDQIDGVAVYRPGKFLNRRFDYHGRFDEPILRGFRRGCGRFMQSYVDEELVISGRVSIMKAPLVHEDPYPSLTVYFEKFNRYTSLTAADLREKGVVLRPRNYAWYFGLKPILVFLHRYIGKRGYRQGVHGFLWYMFRAMAYFVSYAKLWEMQQATGEATNDRQEDRPIP